MHILIKIVYVKRIITCHVTFHEYHMSLIHIEPKQSLGLSTQYLLIFGFSV